MPRWPLAIFAATVLTSIAAPAASSISISLTADRKHVYAGEVFHMTLIVDATGVRLGQQIEILSPPDKSMLWIERNDSLPVERKMISGQLHQITRIVLRTHALKPGRVTYAPSVSIGIVTRRRMLLGTGWVESRKTLAVDPLTIIIKHLPESDRPDDFSGAVGRFVLNAHVEPTDVAVGDLITATMTVSGQGNLSGVPAPSLSPGRTFRVYAPERVRREDRDTATFEQIVIPQSTNATMIAAPTFTYFDPIDGRYRTASTDPFVLTFHPARAAAVDEPYKRVTTSTTTSDHPVPVNQSPESAIAWLIAALGTVIAGSVAIILCLTGNLSTRITTVMLIACVGIMGVCLQRSSAASGLLTRPQSLVNREERALFAPAPSSMVLFTIPRETLVTLFDTHGSWVLVAIDNKRGWIPSSAIAD